MAATSNAHSDPKMSAAIVEVTELIRESYPDTTFRVDIGENQETVYVTAVVDIDDPDEVIDCFIDRVLALQIDEGLPLHVIPIRTPARRDRLRAAQQLGRSSGTDPLSAVG